MIQETIVKCFEHYYSQIYNETGYRANIKAYQKHLDNFPKLLEKNGYKVPSIGLEWINSFILFQLEYYLGLETTSKIKLNWLIGKKAFDRYNSVEDWKQKNYWISINTSHLTKFELEQKQDNEYEINHRKKHHNTESGFLNCIKNTTLYIKHPICISCNFKDQCKKLLKENYPLLWRKRLN